MAATNNISHMSNPDVNIVLQRSKAKHNYLDNLLGMFDE